MDDKKKERSITSFFERKYIQVSENENSKPSDTIRNVSSDQACSTTKRSGSTTASIEPSSEFFECWFAGETKPAKVETVSVEISGKAEMIL